MPKLTADPALRLQPRRGQADPRPGRLQGHERRRHPRDAAAAASRCACATRCARSRTIAQPVAEFVTGWLKDIGIATTQKTYSDSQLTEVIGKGDYDLFVWGWTPFVDPDPMMSYFTCDQVSQDPKNPTNYYNDANWCDKTYSAMYKQQNTELDPAKRRQIVQQMLTRFYESATYVPLVLRGRPAGLPHGQVHGLDPPAGGDRAGAVQQLVADLREPQAGRGVVGVRAAVAAARARSSRSSSRRSSCSAASGSSLARRRSADERE